MGIFRQKPFAVDQRKIFRMTFRIKFLGDQRLQRVNKQRVLHGRPEFFRNIAAVDAGFDRKASVPAQVVGIVQTVFQDRFLCFGKFRQHKVFTDGDLLIQRREEPAAQFFQKLIDSVDHTPDPAGDVEPGVRGLQGEGIVALLILTGNADTGRIRDRSGDNVKDCPGDHFQVVFQFLCGVTGLGIAVPLFDLHQGKAFFCEKHGTLLMHCKDMIYRGKGGFAAPSRFFMVFLKGIRRPRSQRSGWSWR